jgi:two-component system, sensor histidine kinase YesM
MDIRILINKLKQSVNNLNVKKKLFVILFSVLFLFTVISIFIFQLFIYVQNDILKHVASDILGQVSTNIENEFRKIEKLSAIIMTDATLQDDLGEYVVKNANYDRTEIAGMINERLNKYIFEEKYLQGLVVIEPGGYEFVSSNTMPEMSAEMKKRLIDRASEYEGSHVWFYDDEKYFPLLSIRKIREFKNLSLKNLGTLVMLIDINGIIDSSVNENPNYKIDFSIFLGDNQIYISNKDFDNGMISGIYDKGNNQKIIKIRDKTYLITKSFSDQWTYFCMFPYYRIMNKFIFINIMLILVYIIVFCSMVYIGVRITRSITNPIESLAELIKKTDEADNFNVNHRLFRDYDKDDEIGILYREFHIMINKINNLINENYKKQIVIKDAQFRALQAQINPHFLYNTLESINWIAKLNKQDQIAGMVKALGNLLRVSISQKMIHTIRDEVGHLNDYILIQKIRYEDRLDFSSIVDESCNDFGIPKLIIQPFVENSIKYGLEVLTGKCSINAGIRMDKGMIIIEITDNGPGIDADFIGRLLSGKITPEGSGIGIKNINERLKMVYNDEFSFKMESGKEGGTKVTISVPQWNIGMFKTLSYGDLYA